MAEYGVEVRLREVNNRLFYGPMGIIEIEVIKGSPTARRVEHRYTHIYCKMVEKDYAKRADGSHDTTREVRRLVREFRMAPDELFALADYVRSQLATAPPAGMEDPASDEVPE